MTRAGFPPVVIRINAWLAGSPRLIAASYVLHRLLAPRHLHHVPFVTWQLLKMLALAM